MYIEFFFNESGKYPQNFLTRPDTSAGTICSVQRRFLDEFSADG